jgi:hypothetical protein
VLAKYTTRLASLRYGVVLAGRVMLEGIDCRETAYVSDAG